MALVAVLAEQQNDSVSGGSERKAGPAVFLVSKAADIADRRSILLLKQPELLFGKRMKEGCTVVRVNHRLCIMRKEHFV